VLFQSITHMAPAAAVAFSIIVGAQFAAGALPLGVLLALIACLFVASSIGQLAKHLPSAGGFATYTSRGLHPAVGFMVAWLYSLAEKQVLVYAQANAQLRRRNRSAGPASSPTRSDTRPSWS
jgi:amino acid transporter